MAIKINSNIASEAAQRQLGKASDRIATTFERLSSGLRINRASDDPAGLAVAASLNVDSRVFSQAVRNINDGISAINIAEGALTELQNITTRQKELAEQAANGVLSFTQRQSLNAEANALGDEFNRIVSATKFNGRQLLTASNNDLRIQAGYGIDGSINIQIGEQLDRTVGDGTFQTSNFQPSGVNPYSVDTADINGDGILDLVTAESGSNTMGVMLGNGNGTFLARVSYTTLTAPQDIKLGDFNGDGRIDAVVANSSSSSVSILLGNGNGTFLAGVSYSAGGGSQSLTLADFNGDGLVDIGIAESSANRVSILLSNGNGSFRARTSFAVPSSPEDLFAADLNNDGIQDIASISSTTNTVNILLGTGGGSFAAAVSYTTGAGPRGIVVADFDGDGVKDIATADRDSDTVSIFRGNGDGTFLARSTLASYSSPREVQAYDINGDGYIDLISADFTSGVASVYISNGDGTFQASKSYATGSAGSSIRGLAAGDFNGDGALDLAAANYTGNTVNVLLGNTQDVVSIGRISLYTQSDARAALTVLDAQMTRISLELGALGAGHSRFDVALSNLTASRDNYVAAASRITDVDVAEETAELVRSSILQQVATAILAQANQAPSLVLKLLQ